MFNLDHIWLLAILLVVVLIIWGPGKLPDVGAGLGRAIHEFRKASTSARDEVMKATTPTETPAAPAAAVPSTPAPAPAPTAPVATPAATPQGAGEGDQQLPS